jgi:hypothetical protein
MEFSEPTMRAQAVSTQPMKIILARHGKPQVQRWPWMAPDRMKEWIQAYDSAGLHAESVPPDSLKKIQGCGVMVSSSFQRAIESAQALDSSGPALAEAVFREAELPYCGWFYPRLPPIAWAFLFRAAWFFGFSRNAESFAEARARRWR